MRCGKFYKGETDMEFKQLQSFAAVVKYESFTKAAEKLFLSQPTISAHIQALEEELHCQLMIRTTKSIEITPKGMSVYEYAVNILSMRDRMIEECREDPKSIIHLGASTIPSAYILPEILAEYGKISPHIYFIIHQSDSAGVVEGLTDGVFDVGLVGMKFEDPELACIPFCRDRMVLIAPVNSYFLALKEQETPPLKELLSGPVILRESGSGSRKSADLFLDNAGIAEKDLHITARINDQEAIKNLVASGMGVSIISERAAKNFLEEKRLLMFELPEYSGSRELYLVYRKNCAVKDYVTRFMEFVRAFYKNSLNPAGR